MRKSVGAITKVRTKYGIRFQVRFVYTDAETGRRKDIKRFFLNKSDAQQALWEIQRDFKKKQAVAKLNEHKSFSEVAAMFAATKIVPVEFSSDGKKMAGLHELRTPQTHLRVCVEYFGKRKVNKITHSQLEAFKLERIQTPTKTDSKRSVRTINAELQMLNAVLSFAVRNGWLEKNPFRQGESLIRKIDENSRTRTISYNEEQRLLTVCLAEREHLRPLVILALDCGLRRGELFKLAWDDIDFAAELIRLPAPKSKTKKARDVALTNRAVKELMRWQERRSVDDPSVFGIKTNIKRAWTTACRLAGIQDLNFHDLRHSFVTRSIAAGVPIAEAMRASGHATLAMLNRYLNVDGASVKRLAEKLEAHNQQQISIRLEDIQSEFIH